ncbi:MAG: hypothetical protein QNJ53_06005 [Pleurocapsa sp. MO_192.B19]|nr:hypothetical protein [Pleurocapsa sp. MO_192.B19]
MKRVSKLVIYGLITAAIAFTVISTNVTPLSSWQSAIAQVTQTETTTPKRLTITVKVSEPDDLKVSEGEQIEKGEIIADRERERTRLTAQQKQLQLSLDRLKAASITPPAAPQVVPPTLALPPISYLEQEAAVAKTKSAIASIESELELKQEEISYLKGVKNLDPIILEHEQAKLKQLKLNHTAAVREYQLAMGKMQTAKSSRQYQEYQASINTARRVEEMNQARLNYQRQLSEYEQRLTDREFQVTQLQEKLNNVENAIATLAVIKSPYNGTVRRVSWLGQSADGTLTAEVTLMVNK